MKLADCLEKARIFSRVKNLEVFFFQERSGRMWEECVFMCVFFLEV